MHVLQNGVLRVQIAELGAELQSIVTLSDTSEWLWQGDPLWWADRSPLLFPVIGRSPNDTVTIDGAPHSMPPHGFARSSLFRVLEADATEARLELRSNPETIKSFPFDFRLEIAYRLQGNSLTCLAIVDNLDSRDITFQFGFHPAFNWPLPGAYGWTHVVELGNRASPQMMQLDASGLLDKRPLTSPFSNGCITLHPALFQAGAMVFEEDVGTNIAFAAGNTCIEMTTKNLPMFALWQKEGAPFLCMEPWCGTAPSSAQGRALENRNGSVVLPPQASKLFEMHLRFEGQSGSVKV
ncbi:aldose 1-epimerase family protein [Tianweitania sp.]|uniref:aldose 1-epimerase family protein n=1 Tax=Tianweitania sp. TaxID=2021634 RepID=UPI00289C81D3|nr:aldose 1-epimerase family protein [Tianweitania sp.]